MMYRESGKKSYLDKAKKIASFILQHPRLPKDMIPYWDFDAPNIRTNHAMLQPQQSLLQH